MSSTRLRRGLLSIRCTVITRLEETGAVIESVTSPRICCCFIIYRKMLLPWCVSEAMRSFSDCEDGELVAAENNC